MRKSGKLATAKKTNHNIKQKTCYEGKFREYSRFIQHFLPKESHERRYYQSFQSFSPFSDAETPENGETAGHLGLVVDSVAVPLPHVSREHWKFLLSSVLRIVPSKTN